MGQAGGGRQGDRGAKLGQVLAWVPGYRGASWAGAQTRQPPTPGDRRRPQRTRLRQRRPRRGHRRARDRRHRPDAAPQPRFRAYLPPRRRHGRHHRDPAAGQSLPSISRRIPRAGGAVRRPAPQAENAPMSATPVPTAVHIVCAAAYAGLGAGDGGGAAPSPARESDGTTSFSGFVPDHSAGPAKVSAA